MKKPGLKRFLFIFCIVVTAMIPWFASSARRVLDGRSTRRALDTIESLETLEDIRPLCQLLMA